MRSREDFLNHYLDRLVGIALRGLIADQDARPGPIAAGRYALTLPEKLCTLLNEMYDFLDPAADHEPLNGQPIRKERP